ncbi:MAG: allantoicase [Gemmatimonadota bacterium]
MYEFTELVDLASVRLGGALVLANDEFFAPKENLILEPAPVWQEGKYTERGKWMDGWETRRRRTPGHDWCIIKLGCAGVVQGVVVDTTHFKGNCPEACSLEGCALTGVPGMLELESASWRELLGRSQLEGDTRNPFAITARERVTHVRFNIFPDGGVARLRVHGEVVPDWERLARRGQIDLAAAENGGRVMAASDMFFGHRHNLIMPGRGTSMADGWETKRRRGRGNDWVVVRLGRAGTIERIEVDTIHFKGNAPGSCSLDATNAPGEDTVAPETGWRPLLPMTPLQPDMLHVFEAAIASAGAVTHVRLNIFPDGGVSRLRLFGRVASAPC